ncbi:MAG: sugar transferase [Planctomycetia bacterium]|nr:sugar transferase [Planctomycetia bacterium]
MPNSIATEAAVPRLTQGTLSSSGMGRPVPRWKRYSDLAIAAPLLVLCAPIILAAIVLVRLTSRGPGIYSQTRLGLNRRQFTIYKIRTMAFNCESATGAKWATKKDPRVTRLGRFLRATHIDELPQLWNVLRGDMTLVGPRPERPEIVAQLEPLIPGYASRLTVLPGVTGLAQVQLPPDSSVETVRRKLVYDTYYVAHLGLWLDLRLILVTAVKAVGLVAVMRKVLRIPGADLVEPRKPPAMLDTVVANVETTEIPALTEHHKPHTPHPDLSRA